MSTEILCPEIIELEAELARKVPTFRVVPGPRFRVYVVAINGQEYSWLSVRAVKYKPKKLWLLLRYYKDWISTVADCVPGLQVNDYGPGGSFALAETVGQAVQVAMIHLEDFKQNYIHEVSGDGRTWQEGKRGK